MKFLALFALIFFSTIPIDANDTTLLMVKYLSNSSRAVLNNIWWLNRTLAAKECAIQEPANYFEDYAVSKSENVIYCRLKIHQRYATVIEAKTAAQTIRNATGYRQLYILRKSVGESNDMTNMVYLMDRRFTTEEEALIKRNYRVLRMGSWPYLNALRSNVLKVTEVADPTVNIASWIAALNFIINLEKLLQISFVNVHEMTMKVLAVTPEKKAYIVAYTERPQTFLFCQEILERYPIPSDVTICKQYPTLIENGLYRSSLSAVIPIQPDMPGDINLRHFYLNQNLGPRNAPCNQVVWYIPKPRVEIAPFVSGYLSFIITARRREFNFTPEHRTPCDVLKARLGQSLHCVPMTNATVPEAPIMTAVSTRDRTKFINPAQFLLHASNKLNGQANSCRFSVHYPVYNRATGHLM